MDRQEIIRMAREAGEAEGLETVIFHPVFERFANLVAAAEREACAQIIQSYMDSEHIDDPGWNVARDILNDIQGKKE